MPRSLAPSPTHAFGAQSRRTGSCTGPITAAWGHSALKQIDTKNVGDLTPVWTLSTGVDEGHQSPPVVNDGVMYITTPGNQVLALDAASGDLLWRYRRELPDGRAQLPPDEPRRRALWRPRLFWRGGRFPRCARCGLRRARMGDGGRELQTRLLPDARAARRTRESNGRDLGRRARRARVRGRLRRGYGRGGLEDLHDPGTRRARTRHVARRYVEDRRRSCVGHGHLRPRAQLDLLGHGKRGAVDGRYAAGR